MRMVFSLSLIVRVAWWWTRLSLLGDDGGWTARNRGRSSTRIRVAAFLPLDLHLVSSASSCPLLTRLLPPRRPRLLRLLLLPSTRLPPQLRPGRRPRPRSSL